MSRPGPTLKIKLQIFCGDEIAMGPGKADLLEAIAREGSISAAGRALGMSYRRSWLLVDTMNRCWSQSLVETTHGGAEVTSFGNSVLADYRALQGLASQAAASGDWARLQAGLLSMPREHQKA
ncbi:MAG: LysR family transcriptional regulator [Sphingomonadales bacterium]|nr:LysR family transcriptional regulator [Sphingomonadales bacterium]